MQTLSSDDTPDDTLRSRIWDDAPTERFTLQRCPACESTTVVPLFAAKHPCEFCCEMIEVAPLNA